ncbi:protein CLMP1 isoform X2 [Herrania umbratica]|nr:protein CLMP1 isoform X2 [Herrania umbratica]
MAMQDVQLLLGDDPNHKDALEIVRRLRTALGPCQEAQQDLQSRPSPAALGASAVRGAPIAGLGPCLPARPVPKKTAVSPPGGSVVSPMNKLEKHQINLATENGPENKAQLPKLVLKPLGGSLKATDNINKDGQREQSFSASVRGQVPEKAVQWRPLKLVYDHDIRLSQMPVNCSFKVLREIVSKRFPSSKSVLIKYKDNDGDLVTITSTAELRLAESSIEALLPKEPEADKTSGFGMLRLHIVEVSQEQEPPLPEEDEEKPLESEGTKADESGSHSSLGESVSDGVDTDIEKAEKEASNEKAGASEDPECKEVEMDDWLFEFAQLFRTHVGIDPDAHIDLHELGMELCSEALEETVTSEEAQILFDKAAAKFQEVAALAFFNWGNVHMCAARKRIPLDESAGKEVVSAQLQVAYDWVREKYSLAREKYAEALLIKPDFYEGLLALGQQQFEMAKLNWSFALAKKIDLSSWDPAETLQLFDSAEEKMKSATEMWEKLEEQRVNELKDPNSSKKEELLKRRKKPGSGAESELSGTGSQGELSAEEAAEQAAVMRSQIHLFWGNMLFERSQVECKLGMDGWKKNLHTAVERFKLAGASETDISTVLKNHCSNVDAVEGGEKKVVGEADSSEVKQTSDK